MKRLRPIVPPLAFGVVFLLLWELAVRGFGIKPYLLPKPSAIWGQFHANLSSIWGASRVSGTNALIGLAAGAVLGLLLAFAASRFRLLAELLAPISVAAAAMPIIVLVAILNNLFAITSAVPRRLMVTIVVFFVVFVNVAKGLTQANATQLELMRSYGASESSIIGKVRLPNALSFLFVALRQAAPLAVVTAFVSEYFGGNQNGLGSRITSAIATSKDTAGWAYVLAACLLGITFYVLSIVLEYMAMPWARHRRST
jgi:NitT/TauT family transport system permease protein